MKKTFQEMMILKGFKNELNYSVGGMVNGYSDGAIEIEEFEQFVDEGNLMIHLQDVLNDSYKVGYFEIDKMSGVIVEAKHIKFLGNKKITILKEMAIKYILEDQEVKDILERGE